MYTIYKNSRIPREQSYNGSTWDKAGMRHAYKEMYDTREEAQDLADILSQVNAVGFSVFYIGEW